MAGTRKAGACREHGKSEAALLKAEKDSLRAALDSYEAVRLTPGPARADAMAAVKPLLAAFGVFEHRGRVYWWDRGEDSLIRNVARRQRHDQPTRVLKTEPATDATVDAVIIRRRGVDTEDGGNLWHRHYRGRAL